MKDHLSFARYRLALALLVTGTVFSLVCAATPAHAIPVHKTITVATIPSGWPPYIIAGEPEAATSGIMFDVLREISFNLGITLHIVEYPEVRAASMLLSGRVDAYPKAREWVSNPDAFLWTDPVVQVSEVLISHTLRPILTTDPKQLEGMTLGTVLGFRHPHFTAAFSSGTIKREDGPDSESMLRMLLCCRVDAVLTNPYVARWFIKNHPEFADQFHFSPPCGTTCGYRFAFNKHSGWNEFIPLFNKELAAMRKNGRLDTIISSYIGQRMP